MIVTYLAKNGNLVIHNHVLLIEFKNYTNKKEIEVRKYNYSTEMLKFSRLVLLMEGIRKEVLNLDINNIYNISKLNSNLTYDIILKELNEI